MSFSIKMKCDSLVINKGTLADVPRIIDFVVQWLRNHQLAAYSFNIETAVDEAVTNVFKHGYQGRAGYINVSCALKRDVIELVIRDHGKEFDPLKIPPPDLDSHLEDRKAGGLGIYIMKKMMDEVNYNFHTGRGNALTLRKRLN